MSKIASVGLCIALVMAQARAQPGQDPTAELQNELVSQWLIVIIGEPRARGMTIKKVTPTSEGVYGLEMTYGILVDGQGPVKGELVQKGAERTILFTTQANSKISATQAAPGSFQGTFTATNGVVRPLTMSRMSDADIRRKATEELLVKPGADVPEACRQFFGGWAGSWNRAASSEQRLWVLGIKADCSAKVSYQSSSSNEPPISYRNSTIKDGVLSMSCGSNNGKCSFEAHGSDLWVKYTDDVGYNNSGVFRRLQ